MPCEEQQLPSSSPPSPSPSSSSLFPNRRVVRIAAAAAFLISFRNHLLGDTLSVPSPRSRSWPADCRAECPAAMSGRRCLRRRLLRRMPHRPRRTWRENIPRLFLLILAQIYVRNRIPRRLRPHHPLGTEPPVCAADGWFPLLLPLPSLFLQGLLPAHPRGSGSRPAVPRKGRRHAATADCIHPWSDCGLVRLDDGTDHVTDSGARSAIAVRSKRLRSGVGS
jgi:hypothetical protein